MIKVKVTVNKNLLKIFAETRNNVLVALGLHMQDAVAGNTHVQSGLLRNSWNSKTATWESGYGKEAMTDPTEILTNEQEVSKPAVDTVRTGSALSYARFYNDKFAVLEITADRENHTIGKIANAAYKKVIGT